jgi:threonine dehydrogenase-like Zn-dependent dehydrogenase
MAAENCGIKGGETVAVWGCGPVGQFAIRSAFMLGAERVIAIDHHPSRLAMAAEAGAFTLNYEEVDSVVDQISFLTGGRGPDACIDAVGMEAHGHTLTASYDHAKAAVGLATDRIDALRQAIQSCSVGGIVSVPGVYGGLIDKLPFGAAFGKGLTFKMGQTYTQKYMQPLLDRILRGEIDPSFVITHRLKLEDGPKAYATFKNEQDKCIKVIMKPH